MADEVMSPETGRRIAWLDEDGEIDFADNLTLAEARAIHAHFETDDVRFVGSPGLLVAMSRMTRITSSGYDGPVKKGK